MLRSIFFCQLKNTCYVVSLLYSMFLDWARYFLDHGEVCPRKLYINIPLDIDEINAAASKELGEEIDFSDQIIFLDDAFFRGSNGDYRDWWNDFEEKAFVVIDEVHHYLPASMKGRKGAQSDRFMNYISTHRHRQHDVILLTQHVDNILIEAKKMVEVVYEVLNVKNG